MQFFVTGYLLQANRLKEQKWQGSRRKRGERTKRISAQKKQTQQCAVKIGGEVAVKGQQYKEGCSEAIDMKDTDEVAQIAQASDRHIAHCNLLLHMIQHKTCNHDSNGTLTELVKFLAIEYKIMKQLLNLLASLFEYNQMKTKNKLGDLVNVEEL